MMQLSDDAPSGGVSVLPGVPPPPRCPGRLNVAGSSNLFDQDKSRDRLSRAAGTAGVKAAMVETKLGCWVGARST